MASTTPASSALSDANYFQLFFFEMDSNRRYISDLVAVVRAENLFTDVIGFGFNESVGRER